MRGVTASGEVLKKRNTSSLSVHHQWNCCPVVHYSPPPFMYLPFIGTTGMFNTVGASNTQSQKLFLIETQEMKMRERSVTKHAKVSTDLSEWKQLVIHIKLFRGTGWNTELQGYEAVSVLVTTSVRQNPDKALVCLVFSDSLRQDVSKSSHGTHRKTVHFLFAGNSFSFQRNPSANYWKLVLA